MASYLRFEIYIPRIYTIDEIDPMSGLKRPVTHQLKNETVESFISETIEKYNGITQANPSAAPVFKGWWKEPPKEPIDPEKPSIKTDFLTYLFGLVRADQDVEAIAHFTTWKREFEISANQSIILVIYYPVETIGDFF